MTRLEWLSPSELRIGLGCMRLSTDEHRDEDLAVATIAAAAEAGITVFDTARAYGRDAADVGHNERLLARALRDCGAAGAARIVTKGGMARADGAWIPDGRAKTIRADCEATLAALDGLGIDLYLVHAPDPRTPWRTTVRALARLVDEGLVKRVGLSNVNRTQLEDALAIAPIAAVQVALNPFDDRALRGGVVERCAESGIAVMAHSPLGGPRRAASLGRRRELVAVAAAHAAAPAEVALAWLLALSDLVMPIPGARRPETASSAARAAALDLGNDEVALLGTAFGAAAKAPARRARAREDAEVVIVMGIPGAGKSRVAEDYATRHYVRLNRDERGGSLQALAAALDEHLSSGTRLAVLDNTYLTRASRSYVIEAARRHRVGTRCVWLETPLVQAQVNLVERILDRVGSLPDPEELKRLARREPGLHTPTSQMRALRELEPPSVDEGFDAVERLPFVRRPPAERRDPGVFVAAAALRDAAWKHALDTGEPSAAHLVFDWRPDGPADSLAADVAAVAAVVDGPVESALCPHPAGPPTCWCRPPLPGFPLAFARTHAIDPAKSVLIGTSRAHRTLAAALDAAYVAL